MVVVGCVLLFRIFVVKEPDGWRTGFRHTSFMRLLRMSSWFLHSNSLVLSLTISILQEVEQGRSLYLFTILLRKYSHKNGFKTQAASNKYKHKPSWQKQVKRRSHQNHNQTTNFLISKSQFYAITYSKHGAEHKPTPSSSASSNKFTSTSA